ncbi:MFS transporter [Sphingobium limneticum]|jgi:ACS family hexuronate transporter-like MFS transporter|uniref:MFS transporter n=1 Tax=Sphingobium limneticum TaxID=1007511 RepID=A0A5J5HXZ9_9SPHN|nr:MFS transporter [Sphingobium limneticum]KAA9014675.1 MFS transporter [Sphingobium limneticum]KAA9027687.1 MFS transporter [Sphingobium limneticum]
MRDDNSAASQARRRYLLIALVFFGTVLSYVDRQVLALLKPTLEATFHWSDEDFAHLGSAFSLAMATSVLFSGWLVDRFGVRIAYGWAVAIWSLAGMAHAAAATVTQFVLARVTLALGESVSGPATVKATAQYLPLRERSFGLGIITTAPSIGAIMTPLVIPPVAVLFGWQSAFLLTGGLGVIWVFLWVVGTRHLRAPRAVSVAPAKAGVDWAALFSDRRTWAITGSKAMADMVWWFLLFWIPDLFSKVFGLSQAQIGGPVALTYAMAALGALASGGLFPMFLRKGLSFNAARKLSMLCFAVLILPLPLALFMGSPWAAAAIIGVALFAHNGFVTNIFGVTADIIPLQRVGTVTALSSVAGNLSGMGMIEFAGWSLTNGHGYWPMFAVASVAYLAATLFLHLVVPSIVPVHDMPGSAG